MVENQDPFTKIHPYTLPPAEVSFYRPTKDDIKTGEGKKGMRVLWGGHPFDAFEREKLAEFKTKIAKHKEYDLPSFYDDVLLLKTLDGCKWKMDKAFKSLKDHAIWRQNYLPPALTDATREMIETGVVYLGGRDHKYRPIIVINVIKVNQFVEKDKKTMPDQICRASFWLMEYIIHNMYLPGKIENWVVLIDFAGVKGMSIPTGFLKKFSTMLQDNYRGVLFRMYMVKVPKLLSTIWAFVKLVLDPVTLLKIQVTKKPEAEGLWSHINKGQIEERFGGTEPNVTSFWPPHRFGTDYFAHDEVPMKFLTYSDQAAAREAKKKQADLWDGKVETPEKTESKISAMDLIKMAITTTYIHEGIPEEEFEDDDMDEDCSVWKQSDATAIHTFAHHIIGKQGFVRPTFLLKNPEIARLLDERTIHRESDETALGAPGTMA